MLPTVLGRASPLFTHRMDGGATDLQSAGDTSLRDALREQSFDGGLFFGRDRPIERGGRESLLADLAATPGGSAAILTKSYDFFDLVTSGTRQSNHANKYTLTTLKRP